MLHNNRLVLLLILISLISYACTSGRKPVFECTDELGCVNIAPEEPVKLGVIQTLSGGVAPNGLSQLRTIQLAVAHHDDQLLGHPITLQIEDEMCTNEGGANAAIRVLADSQILGILGTTCSDGATAVSEIMSDAGLVMISGSNSAASLTAIGANKGEYWQAGYFRTVFNGAEEGRADAIFALQGLRKTRAATINSREVYSEDLTSVFEQTFTQLGGEIVLSAVVDPEDPNMLPVLTSVINSDADLLFFPVLNPGSIYLIRQAQQMPEFEDIALLTVEGVIIESFLDEINTSGIGVYFSTPALINTPMLEDVTEEYVRVYGEAPAHKAFRYAYDAADILLHAIETVAQQDADGTIHISRQALRDTMYATTGFEGITGSLTCNEFGDCSAMSFNIVRLDDPQAGVDALYSNVIYTVTDEP